MLKVLLTLTFLFVCVPSIEGEWPDNIPVLPQTATYITRAEISINDIGFVTDGSDARLDDWLGLMCDATDFSESGASWPFWGWWSNPEMEPRDVYARVYVREQLPKENGGVDWWLWCDEGDGEYHDCVQRTKSWQEARVYTHPIYGFVQRIESGYYYHHYGLRCVLPG